MLSSSSSARSQPLYTQNQDAAIIKTADRAILSKLSCVEYGYYNDPFVRPMSSRGCSSSEENVHKRPSRSISSSIMEPIIRRGTHARVKAIDSAIQSFLSLNLQNDTRQIIVLGSGRDTTYLRYRFGHYAPESAGFVRWYEVDHPSVICQKAYDWLPGCIPKGYDYERAAVTLDMEDTSNTPESYVISINKRHDESDAKDHKSSYHLVGHDLRHSPSHLFDRLLLHPQHKYDKSVPTLIILECVVMYLPDEQSRELLKYLTENIKSAQGNDSFVAVAMYDTVPGNDRFGNVMIQNLHQAGIVNTRRKKGSDEDEDNQILSLEATPTVSDQLNKFIQCGFDVAVGCDMMDAYNHGVIHTDDVRHAAKCEMLDELEEFNLLMKHYCFVVSVKSTTKDSVGFNLCSIGEDSLIGFEARYCTALNTS